MSQTVNERQLALVEILGLSLYELSLKEKPDFNSSLVGTINSRWYRKASAQKVSNAFLPVRGPQLLNQPDYMCGMGSFREFSTGLIIGSALSQIHNMQ